MRWMQEMHMHGETGGLDCDDPTYFHDLLASLRHQCGKIPAACKETEKTIRPSLNTEFYARSSSCGHLKLEKM